MWTFVVRMAPDVSQFQPKVYFYSSSCDYYFSNIFSLFLNKSMRHRLVLVDISLPVLSLSSA